MFANMNSFSAGSYPAKAVLYTQPKYVYDDTIVNQFSDNSHIEETRRILRETLKKRKTMVNIDPAVTDKIRKTYLATLPESDPVSGDIELTDELADNLYNVVDNMRAMAEQESDPKLQAKLDIEANVFEKSIGDAIERQKAEKKSNVDIKHPEITYDEVDRLDKEVGRVSVPDSGLEEPYDAPPMSFLDDATFEKFYNEWTSAKGKKAQDDIVRRYSEDADFSNNGD